MHYSNKAHAEALAAAAERAKIVAAKQAAFKTAVNTVIADHPDTQISVVAIDLQDNAETDFNSRQPFTAASTGKLLSAVTYLHLVEQGKLTLTSKVKQDLKDMVELSDNDSWKRINDAVTHERLEDYANVIGMKDYDPSENILSAYDMAQLIKKLYGGDLLKESNRDLILSYMKDANYREAIISHVPSDYTTYHKIGFTGGNIHDVAIITKDGRSMALLIYTDGSGTYDSTKRTDIFEPITQAALKAYF